MKNREDEAKGNTQIPVNESHQIDVHVNQIFPKSLVYDK